MGPLLTGGDTARHPETTFAILGNPGSELESPGVQMTPIRPLRIAGTAMEERWWFERPGARFMDIPLAAPRSPKAKKLKRNLQRR